MDKLQFVYTSDVKPVEHGVWEDRVVCDGDNIIDAWQSAKCSNCGLYHTTPYMYCFQNYSYCPNCGAKMFVEGTVEPK